MNKRDRINMNRHQTTFLSFKCKSLNTGKTGENIDFAIKEINKHFSEFLKV